MTHDSFIDTTPIIDDLPEGSLAAAIADQDRHLGVPPPNLVVRIQDAVRSHGALTAEQREAVFK